ncbi:hypothetical protein, partial [Mesorhizobium sp.]|uniref:hypothetical protein n=1 Tax=Mesorhizobium sp. TaxID=1871066 RepID=UPI00257B2A5D
EVASTLIKTLRCEWIHGFIADFFNTIGIAETSLGSFIQPKDLLAILFSATTGTFDWRVLCDVKEALQGPKPGKLLVEQTPHRDCRQKPCLPQIHRNWTRHQLRVCSKLGASFKLGSD